MFAIETTIQQSLIEVDIHIIGNRSPPTIRKSHVIIRDICTIFRHKT